MPALSKEPAMSEAAVIPVLVSKSYADSPERVFDAWLSARSIGQFMFGPRVRDEEIVRLRTDAVVGGTFSFVVRRQGQEINHVGQYLEIERPTRLVFTWGVAPETSDGSRVAISVTSTASGADLTLVHELAPAWADYADRVRGSWGKMLDALEVALRDSTGIDAGL